MCNGVKPFRMLGRIECGGRKTAAHHFAALIKYIRAERARNVVLYARSRKHEMAHIIQIDDARAQLGKHMGNGRFPRPNAANKRDGFHRHLQ